MKKAIDLTMIHYVLVNCYFIKEILKLGERTREIGYSLIPLKLYLKHGQCKVLLGVARGKKLHDKRQALKEKAMKRDIDRAVKDRY